LNEKIALLKWKRKSNFREHVVSQQLFSSNCRMTDVLIGFNFRDNLREKEREKEKEREREREIAMREGEREGGRERERKKRERERKNKERQTERKMYLYGLFNCHQTVLRKVMSRNI
jgi:hypothetical protein